jgi:small subunit ribosomal protein S9
MTKIDKKSLVAKTVGKRKTSIAKVFLITKNEINDKVDLIINDKNGSDYLCKNIILLNRATEPLIESKKINEYIISCTVYGGGIAAQADAIRLGVAKALLEIDSDLRPFLKSKKYLTRDARVKERNKIGFTGARGRPSCPIR